MLKDRAGDEKVSGEARLSPPFQRRHDAPPAGPQHGFPPFSPASPRCPQASPARRSRGAQTPRPPAAPARTAAGPRTGEGGVGVSGRPPRAPPPTLGSARGVRRGTEILCVQPARKLVKITSTRTRNQEGKWSWGRGSWPGPPLPAPKL